MDVELCCSPDDLPGEFLCFYQPTQRGGEHHVVGVEEDTYVHPHGEKTKECHQENLAQIDLP